MNFHLDITCYIIISHTHTHTHTHMSTSADNLFDVITRYDDISRLEMSAMVDYCFANHFESGNPYYTNAQYNLLGLYKGCILLGATRKQFHQAAISNRLAEFITTTYNGQKSGYYTMFLNGDFNLKNIYTRG